MDYEISASQVDGLLMNGVGGVASNDARSRKCNVWRWASIAEGLRPMHGRNKNLGPLGAPCPSAPLKTYLTVGTWASSVGLDSNQQRRCIYLRGRELSRSADSESVFAGGHMKD